MIILFLLFVFPSVLSLKEITYNDATCSVTSYYNDYIIYHNTATYFRSPNFPATMYNSTLINQNFFFCNARFNTETENSNLWFVLFNGETFSFSIFNNQNENVTTDYFDGNYDYFYFAPSYYPIMFKFNQDSYSPQWTAFEGIVYAYTSKNVCPFSGQTTNLESNRVIPIASSYIPDILLNSNCKWTFSINPSQTFKIVLKSLYSLYASEDTGLQLETDGNILAVFDTNVNSFDPKVYYYGSESGIFSLSYNTNDTDISLSFFALVSAVDKNPNNPKKICKQNTTGIYTYIGNLDNENGYSEFDGCNYQLSIPHSYEIVLNSDSDNMIIEKNVDKLILYDQTGQIFDFDDSYYYFLTSDANGTILDFTADGNIQQAGFKVQQIMLNCQCAPSNVVIPCNQTLGITALNETSYYCSNMSCNFTISLEQTCNATYFGLQYNLYLRYNDFIVLNANGMVKENFTRTSSSEIVFSKSTNVSLQFTSGQAQSPISSNSGKWYISATAKNPNILSTYQLNETLPFHLLQMTTLTRNDAFVICSPKNDTLELFIADTRIDLEAYLLYDSDKMENFVGDLSSPLIATVDNRYPSSIISSSGCFSIYVGESPRNVSLFFRMQKAHSKNCKSTNNVFAIHQGNNTPIAGAANESGPCEIMLLSATSDRSFPAILLQTIQSSSTFKVSSPFNQKTIIEISTTDVDAWQGTTLYALALTFVVPPSQNISVTAIMQSTPVNIHLSDSVNNGVFASPNYGGYDISGTYTLYNLYNYYNNYTVELSVKDMNGNGTAIFFNSDENKNVTLQQNQTVTQIGTQFNLFYNNYNSFTFLIEYKVTKIIISTTTQPPTTTPTITTANVTLDSSNPYYVFWLDNLADNGYLTVCTDNDDNLELFVTTGYELYKFDLYDYKGLYNYIGTLASNQFSTSTTTSPKSIISSSNCFTIVPTYNTTKALTTLLFRRYNRQRQYCYGNNIFQAPSSSSSNTTFYANVYGNGGNCEVIFLASLSELPIIRIGSITSISSNEINSYVFKSAINQKNLMIFNNTDATNWRNVAIYTNALSMTLTIDTTIVLVNGIPTITKDKNSFQRGILVSPSYSGFYAKLNGSNELYQLTNYRTTGNKTVASFAVKSLDQYCNVTVRNDYTGINHTFTQNERYTVAGNQFEIFYKEKLGKNSGFLIEYSLIAASSYKFVTLSYTSPTYFYWLANLNFFELLTVCSPESDTLQMFVANEDSIPYGYALYDGDLYVGNLTSGVLSSNYANSPKQIFSTSGCFTIQNQNAKYDNYVSLFFRMQNVHSKNCDYSNVYEVQSTSTSIQIASSSSGTCETIILSSGLQYPTIPIKSFNSFNSGSCNLRSGINKKNLITIDFAYYKIQYTFDFSSNNANLWNNFQIYTPALSIMAQSSNFFTLQIDSNSAYDYEINGGIAGQKGIIVSPAYNGFFKPFSGTLFTYYNYPCQSSKCGINFEVNSTDSQSVMYNDGSDHLFYQNDNITVFQGGVQVKYAHSQTNSSFLITYTIVNSPESSNQQPSSSASNSYTAVLLCFIILIMKN